MMQTLQSEERQVSKPGLSSDTLGIRRPRTLRTGMLEFRNHDYQRGQSFLIEVNFNIFLQKYSFSWYLYRIHGRSDEVCALVGQGGMAATTIVHDHPPK